jgi:hypothetical protein
VTVVRLRELGNSPACCRRGGLGCCWGWTIAQHAAAAATYDRRPIPCLAWSWGTIVGTRKERRMQEQIQARLEALRHEFEAGRAELQALELRQTSLRETLLRIDGAVQALEELLPTVSQSGTINSGGRGASRTASDDSSEA